LKEVPMPYVKANQAGIVLFIIAAFILGQPWIIAALWFIQTVGQLLGGRFNLFVRIAKPFLHVEGRETQAAELQRFNNTLAVLFLTLSLISFALGWIVVAYVFAAMLLLAAGAALLGYCIGCTIYYQYKKALALKR
jgi:hypothetical protein